MHDLIFSLQNSCNLFFYHLDQLILLLNNFHMTETDVQNTTFPQQSFRKAALTLIFNIKRKLATFSRCSQFLAISILDKYLNSYSQVNNSKYPPVENSFLTSMACLFLASKFNGTNEKLFQKYLTEICQCEEEKKKIVEEEGNILLLIDFQIPSETCFTQLECHAQSEQSEKGMERSILTKCMKIMMVSLELNDVLSKKPQIGSEIYNLVKKKSGTRRAMGVYEEVQRRGKCGKTQ